MATTAVVPGGSSSVPSLPPPCPKSPPEYPDLYGKRRLTAKVQLLSRDMDVLEASTFTTVAIDLQGPNDELKSIQSLQPASVSCKELVDFVVANPDPLIPTNRKRRRSCRFWKWLCSLPCFNLSCTCCCLCHRCCRHRCHCPECSVRQELPDCCHCSSCNCCSCFKCPKPKLQCCCPFPCPTSELHCCSLACPTSNCCSSSCPTADCCRQVSCSCKNCSRCDSWSCQDCCCRCSCWLPKCPKLQLCCSSPKWPKLHLCSSNCTKACCSWKACCYYCKPCCLFF